MFLLIDPGPGVATFTALQQQHPAALRPVPAAPRGEHRGTVGLAEEEAVVQQHLFLAGTTFDGWPPRNNGINDLSSGAGHGDIPKWMAYKGKSWKSIYKWMIWGYPHFKKPPHEGVLQVLFGDSNYEFRHLRSVHAVGLGREAGGARQRIVGTMPHQGWHDALFHLAGSSLPWSKEEITRSTHYGWPVVTWLAGNPSIFGA